MKSTRKLLGIIALVAVIGFAMAACDKDDPISSIQLPGDITISPTDQVTTGMELTATYNGNETVNYQWRNGLVDVGTNSKTFTPTEAGVYTVTVTAPNFIGKTSSPVTVTIPIGPQWTVADSTFGTSGIVAITYGNGKFVAGGYSGKMAYSSDGVTWTAVTNSTFDTTSSSNINSIVYGVDKFVAGGSNGKMAYSSDGVTWTAATVPSHFGTSSSIKVFYGNNKFFAVGTSAQFATSSDGVTWTTENRTFAIPVNTIVYGNNKYVAGGGIWSTTANADKGKIIATSTDGETWTLVDIGTMFGSDNDVQSIAFGGGKFIAMTNQNTSNAKKTATSTDGTTWTAVTDNPLNGNLVYSNGKFVVTGLIVGDPITNSRSRIAISTDGTTWTTTDLTIIFGLLVQSAVCGGDKIVAVGLNGKIAYISDN